jgi:hypothetical protein
VKGTTPAKAITFADITTKTEPLPAVVANSAPSVLAKATSSDGAATPRTPSEQGEVASPKALPLPVTSLAQAPKASPEKPAAETHAEEWSLADGGSLQMRRGVLEELHDSPKTDTSLQVSPTSIDVTRLYANSSMVSDEANHTQLRNAPAQDELEVVFEERGGVVDVGNARYSDQNHGFADKSDPSSRSPTDAQEHCSDGPPAVLGSTHTLGHEYSEIEGADEWQEVDTDSESLGIRDDGSRSNPPYAHNQPERGQAIMGDNDERHLEFDITATAPTFQTLSSDDPRLEPEHSQSWEWDDGPSPVSTEEGRAVVAAKLDGDSSLALPEDSCEEESHAGEAPIIKDVDGVDSDIPDFSRGIDSHAKDGPALSGSLGTGASLYVPDEVEESESFVDDAPLLVGRFDVGAGLDIPEDLEAAEVHARQVSIIGQRVGDDGDGLLAQEESCEL